MLALYFPALYDIKYLMKSCKTLKGGLQEVADELQVRRVGKSPPPTAAVPRSELTPRPPGPQHQAGSDALLTGRAFFKIRALFFDGIVEPDRFSGMIAGF